MCDPTKIIAQNRRKKCLQVPHVQCPEMAAGSAIPQTPQMMSTQQASSMAGGLVNNVTASIASIWHSVTGR